MKKLTLLLLLLNTLSLVARPVSEAQLLQALADRDKTHIRSTDSMLLQAYHNTSDEERRSLLNFYTAGSSSGDVYTAARSFLWQGIINLRPPFNNAGKAFNCMQHAISKAIESGDEYFMVSCFEIFALNCMSMGKPEISLFYFLKSGEIRNRIGDRYFAIDNAGFYGQVGDLLYKMQEYSEAVHYIRLSVEDKRTPPSAYALHMNTIGLACQRMGKQDSARYWYNRAMVSAIANKDTVWQGIISGNMGASYFEEKQFDKALPLLWRDYYATLEREPNSAGNTLHRISLIYLAQNKTDSAFLLAKRSYSLVTAAWPYNAAFIKNASLAMGEVYKKLNNTDSAFYYSDIYHHINDSLNSIVSSNRADVVQAKLDFEKLSSNINVLLSEKQAEKARRNFLLACIILLLAVAWFYFRWQRQQHLNKQQQLLHRQQMTEADMSNAREKLEEFTQHMLEKNQLIETLQYQLVQQNTSVNEELQNQSILTENDWLRFKEMFEKVHPGFIGQVQHLAPGITTAEIRLATLIKLSLGNKHIASMLGIGTDAVRKTKSRLRQRLQITVEDGLEEYISKLSQKS